MELTLILVFLLTSQAISKSYLIETDGSVNSPDLDMGAPTHMGAPSLLSSPNLSPIEMKPVDDGINHDDGIGKGLPIEEAKKLWRAYKRLPDEWHEKVSDSFDFIDKDENGKITTIEVANVLKPLGKNPSDAWLKDIMRENENDQDKNRSIDGDEFLTMMLKKKHTTSPKKRKSFDKGDTNKNGKISVLERNTNLDEKIKLADYNGDGEIVYEEFLTLRHKWKGRLRTLVNFIIYDSDHSGKVSMAEIEVVRTNQFNRVDMDRDGQITYPEYKLATMIEYIYLS